MFLATRLSKYYAIVCYFFIEQGNRAKPEKKSKENHATKMMKKTKTKLPKFVMSRAIVDGWVRKGPKIC